MPHLRRLVVAAAAVLVSAGHVLAVMPAKPSPPVSPAVNPLATWGVVVLVVAIVCAGAMKSAKRTHQD